MILVTGATGYIGGRLVRQLEKSGHRIRCLARCPQNLAGRLPDATEVVAGDALDNYDSLEKALEGVTVAFYLIHSMGSAQGFEEADRCAARNFAKAANKQGVRRIIYLGGLGHDRDLSPHLRSRQEVGEILRTSGVETVEFRASVIVGSGSLSFELVRAIVEKLPVMITPRWVSALAQPIGVEDVLLYLEKAIDHSKICGSEVFEIGGPDRISYLGLMREYARQRGLRRWMIRVPMLTARISSLWLGLVTPLYARVGRKLIDSLRHDTVVTDDRARSIFNVQPMTYQKSLQRALHNEDREFAQTRWSDPLSSRGAVPSWGGMRFGERIVDSRSVTKSCPSSDAFATIQSIGGEQGWYYANCLWWLRGFLDLLVGGVGMRRGRRHPNEIRVGDAVDFWRVESINPGRSLCLSAEMKLPGRAWLQFEVAEHDNGCRIVQTAIFDPVGLSGQLYWYLLYPLHRHLFRNMLRRIAEISEERFCGKRVTADADAVSESRTLPKEDS